MKRKDLLLLLNRTVKTVAYNNQIKPYFIQRNPKRQDYVGYVENMFNFIKDPHLFYLYKRKK